MMAAGRQAGGLWKPALLAGGLVIAGLALRNGWGRSALDAPASAGPAAFVVAGAFACAVGVPRQMVAYAGGLGYGGLSGMVLAMAAQLFACAADYLWARMVMRQWAMRRVRGRLARLDAQLRRHPFTLTLTLRLLPVGSNLLLNLLAGVSGVAAVPFLLGSATGYVPQTVVFGLLGGGTRVGQGEQLAVAAALFVVAAGWGIWLLRRARVAEPLTPALSQGEREKR